MVVEPLWERALYYVCVLKIVIKTEVPEKPVCYIQVIYVIKNH